MAIHEAMDAIDPDGDGPETWETLSEDDRNFYRAVSGRVLAFCPMLRAATTE